MTGRHDRVKCLREHSDEGLSAEAEISVSEPEAEDVSAG
jgi:hypothetical protein